MNENETLKAKIEELLKEENAELIEFKVYLHFSTYNVRCLVDYPAGGITVDTCSKFNHRIVSFLEETKLLGEDFVVEVNSPGLDRPLKEYKDFLRKLGKTIGVWLKVTQEEKAYWEGEIIEVNENGIVLKAKDKLLNIELTNINVGKEKIQL
ncbi:MAG: hypothetical protein PHQ96_03850 [Candidatus Omnitrophica bacterium]|nr:hypothetical protein [Candidatus Omnitrophota bacterium]